MPAETSGIHRAEPAPLRAAPRMQALVSYLEHEPQHMIVLGPDHHILVCHF